MRTIETKDYAALTPPSSFGRTPKLEWLLISQLVVDPEYQREITLQGRKNVRRIASGFNWSMFTPVIVAPVGGNKFAIVDGQHRTTAASLVKVEKVPCAIIEAQRGEQAAAFRAINANITRLHTVQLHHAALAAGDQEAERIGRVCKRSGVSILRYPKAAYDLAVGETLAVKTIGKTVARFGDVATIAALKAIVGTGGGNPGLLSKVVIWGVAEVLHDHKEWIEREKKLHAALDNIILDEIETRAQVAAKHTKGKGATEHFVTLLTAALEPRMQGKAA